MDAIDRRIINELQDAFPIVDRPFATVAEKLNLDENDLIARVQQLRETGVASRFGPMYQAERMGGALTLCALSAPPERFDDVVEIVNSFAEVAHNYEREHELNMWFVVATEEPGRIAEVLAEIEEKTRLPVYDFPKEAEYFVGLRFVA